MFKKAIKLAFFVDLGLSFSLFSYALISHFRFKLKKCERMILLSQKSLSLEKPYRLSTLEKKETEASKLVINCASGASIFDDLIKIREDLKQHVSEIEQLKTKLNHWVQQVYKEQAGATLIYEVVLEFDGSEFVQPILFPASFAKETFNALFSENHLASPFSELEGVRVSCFKSLSSEYIVKDYLIWTRTLSA